MNGELKVAQASEMRVGYSFTMPVAHAAATIGLVGAKVAFEVTCRVGTPSSSTLVVAIPDQSYLHPEDTSAWYPTGDQKSTSTFHGSSGRSPLSALGIESVSFGVMTTA